jgi:hypothetical protein
MISINDPKVVGGRFGETFFNETRNDGFMIDNAKNFDSTIDFTLGNMRVLMKNPYSRLGSIKGRLMNWGQQEYPTEIKNIMTNYYQTFMPKFKDLFQTFYNVMVFIDKQKDAKTLNTKINNFLGILDEFKTKLDNVINGNATVIAQPTNAQTIEGNENLNYGGKRHQKTRRHTNRRKRSYRHH